MKGLSRSLGRLTVPEGFEASNRSQVDTIRNRKVREMVRERQKSEEDALSHRFQANEVPITTKIPMYEAIAQQQKEKSRVNIEKRKQELLMNSAAFSFYEKDLEKLRQRKETQKDKIESVMRATSGGGDEAPRRQTTRNPIEVTSRNEMFKKMEKAREERKAQEREDRMKRLIEEREEIFKKYCTTATMKLSISKYQTKQESLRSGQALTWEE